MNGHSRNVDILATELPLYGAVPIRHMTGDQLHLPRTASPSSSVAFGEVISADRDALAAAGLNFDGVATIKSVREAGICG